MNSFSEKDEFWMRRALQLAQHAQLQQEVPVGAVVVLNEKAVGEGYNQPIQSHDPSAHAEIMAVRQASLHLKNYRLTNTTLYVTLEPCPMCASLLVHARVQRVVFATPNPRTGAVGSVLNILQNSQLNHQIVVQNGLLQHEASEMLRNFFTARRKAPKVKAT